MNKREQLESLRTAQSSLKDLYGNLARFDDHDIGLDRIAILTIIRTYIGPVVHNLQNEVEQEELFNDPLVKEWKESRA